MKIRFSPEITIYGSDWCPFTTRARRWMDEWDVAYHYVDLDCRPDELKMIASWNGGRALRPTFDIGGQILLNPNEDALRKVLRSKELL